MSEPAAKKGDRVTGTDSHNVMVPNVPPPPGEHQETQDLQFNGPIDSGLSSNVNIMGKAAATVGSTATNFPPHTVVPPATKFVSTPSNSGTVTSGSEKVKINGKNAARNGDKATTCNDAKKTENASITASGTVLLG